MQVEELRNIHIAYAWFKEQEKNYGRSWNRVDTPIDGYRGTVSYRVLTLDTNLNPFIHHIYLKPEPLYKFASKTNQPGAGPGHGIDDKQLPHVMDDEKKPNAFIAFIGKFDNSVLVIKIHDFLDYVYHHKSYFKNEADSAITGKTVITYAVPVSILKKIDWQMPKDDYHPPRSGSLDDFF